MRRSIRELERSLDVSDSELAEQEEAGTLPVDCEGLQLAMMDQSCVPEHRFIQSHSNFYVPQRWKGKKSLQRQALKRGRSNKKRGGRTPPLGSIH